MSSPVNYELTGNIGVIRIDNPPVNALSRAVRQGIMEALQQAEQDASQAVVIVCEGRTFIAGADISEFGKPLQDPWLPAVVNRIEACEKPVVAAIHGTALGGGFEVALGAHYRCAVASAKVGLPEVKLGLLPGAGGTQRLSRLIGGARAKEMVLLSEPVMAEKALDWGLVNIVAAADKFQATVAETAARLAAGAPLAQKLAKALLYYGAQADQRTGLFIEGAVSGGIALTRDLDEGITSMMYRRPPRFTGR
jgi:3-hydroxyacyl-CoA dehydrogenase